LKKDLREVSRHSPRGLRALGALGVSLLLIMGAVLAIASSSQEPLLSASPRAADRLPEAKCAFADRDYGRAEALARDALRVCSDRREWRLLLGRVLLARGRLAEARDLFAELLKTTPDDVESLLGMALVLRRLGLADLALVHLEHAARLRPGDPVVWKELGQAQREKGDSIGALSSFQRSLGLDDKQEDLLGLLPELASAKQSFPEVPSGLSRGRSTDPRAMIPQIPRPYVPDPSGEIPKPFWSGVGVRRP
jgi:tetratricopeptide (TPR) repeat protein